MQNEHEKPSFSHTSPQEAIQAPTEEFLYLACLHEGTGVREASEFGEPNAYEHGFDIEDVVAPGSLPLTRYGDRARIVARGDAAPGCIVIVGCASGIRPRRRARRSRPQSRSRFAWPAPTPGRRGL